MSMHDQELLLHTPANRHQLSRAQALWSDLMPEVLHRGYYGRAAIDVFIEDGTIQRVECRTHRRCRPAGG